MAEELNKEQIARTYFKLQINKILIKILFESVNQIIVFLFSVEECLRHL